MTADIQPLGTRHPGPRDAGVFIEAGFVILFALSQFYMSLFIIPRFSAIYRDMLGDEPVPSLTAAVLNGRWVLAGAGCFCVIATLFVVQRRASMRYLHAILAVLLVLLAATTVALFLPISGIIIKAR